MRKRILLVIVCLTMLMAVASAQQGQENITCPPDHPKAKDGDINNDSKSDWFWSRTVDGFENDVEEWCVDPNDAVTGDEYFAKLWSKNVSGVEEKYLIGRCPFEGGNNSETLIYERVDGKERYVGFKHKSVDDGADDPGSLPGKDWREYKYDAANHKVTHKHYDKDGNEQTTETETKTPVKWQPSSGPHKAYEDLAPYVNASINWTGSPMVSYPFEFVDITPTDIFVSTNRYVVLDDPNTGKVSPGFNNPNRNWGSNYWNGESTTIRAIALATDHDNGSVKSGVNIIFRLKYPNGTVVNTGSGTTNANGIAYYSYDLNTKNYWGNWTIDANATIGGTNKQNSTSFILNWWGCPSCHGSKSLGTITHTPKSYYVKGYNFHNANLASKHNDSMSTGSCTQCHKSYDYTPDWHTGKVVCAGCHINSTIQGRNPEIAGCYDTEGCHTKKNTHLTEINTTTGYILGGNYRTIYSNIPNATKAHKAGTDCILCHQAGHNISKPFDVINTSNTDTENEQCWNCHTSRNNTHKNNNNCINCHSQDAHNVSIVGGGPDCISCHGLGGSTLSKVDESAMNLSIHANLNSNASSTVNPENKKCWGCHQSNGNQPTDMGDRYTNPYKCYDCHNGSRVDPYSGLIVTEHFKGGQDIKAAKTATDNSTSCLPCHNLSEMKVFYTDNIGTTFSFASHYGKSRNDMIIGGNVVNCSDCHQNDSTAFSVAMTNIGNKKKGGHSATINFLFFNITIVCNLCHGTGRMHDSSLVKPNNSDDTYCKTCHTNKEEHKALYCTECHANNTDRSKAGTDIHEIKYLQKNNTFSQNKTSSADCVTCHQLAIVDGSITFVPPKIDYPMHHSDGSKWGDYWTNESNEICKYCHDISYLHRYKPLGRIPLWNNDYITNLQIGDGTNCADCHYKGDDNYSNMSSVFTASGLNIPPEITNGSWNGKAGYYNHTLSNYTDSQCKTCHDRNGSTTVGQLVHNISAGISDDCISCHLQQQGSYPDVNTTMFTKHKNVNTSDGDNNISNNDCKTCHYDITNMNNLGWTTPTKTCNDCHTGSSGPTIENHRPVGGPNINITTTGCEVCHNSSIIKYSYSANASTSHYTTKTSLVGTKDCLYCHKNSINGNYWGGATDPWNSPTFPHSLTTTTKEECYSCHGDISVGTASFHNKTLEKLPLSSVSCLDCHKLGANMSLTKIDSSVSSTAVHKNKNCSDCHTGATTDNMNTYSVVTNPPVVCTTCHAGLEHQPSAPDVQTTIYCKDCHNNNGMYTVNTGTNGTEDAVVHYIKDVTNTVTTPYGHNVIDTSNCMNCHGNGGPYTGDPNWGSPVDISTSPKRVHTETTIAECNNCHKDNTIQTLANVDFHNSALTGGAGGDNCIGCHAGVE